MQIPSNSICKFIGILLQIRWIFYCKKTSYPKKVPFLIGSLGCTKNCTSEDLLFIEIKLIIVQPSFVCVYGPLSKELKYILESYDIAYDVFKPRREISFSKSREVE
jgi:hypothetical protein